MGTIFHWFYCLPIPDAVLLIILATVAFLFLRNEYGNTPFWKAGVPVLFLCWIAVILFGTLWQRVERGYLLEPILTPFHSYYVALNGGNKEIFRTNFMNIVLFYPSGLLGFWLLPKRWHAAWKVILLTAIFALLSIGIEYTQYRFGLGLTEVDDVIHNTLGALLGAIISGTFGKFSKKQLPSDVV